MATENEPSTKTEDALPTEGQNTNAIGERQALTKTGTGYKLQGRVLWSDEKAARDLVVKVYDKDLFNDDFLGTTMTADDGGFDLEFDEKDFKDWIFDRKPDLYFIISDDKDKELFNTKKFVINNADEKTTPITLILD